MDLNIPGVEKLIELLKAPFGTVVEPYQNKRLASADAEAINTLSKAIRNNSDIDINYNKNGIQLSNNPAETIERTIQRLCHREIFRQENLEKIAGLTHNLLEKNSNAKVSEKPVDRDWFMKFMNYAQDVSNEKVQAVWAELLAEEIINTGTVSYRTLNVLHDLRHDDVALFQRLTRYVVGDDFIYNNDELFKEWGISYDDILQMDDAGLINSSGMLNKVRELSDEMGPVLFFDKYVLLGKSKNKPKEQLLIQEFLLTKAGKELYEIIGESIHNDDIIEVARKIKDQNINFIFSLHKIKSRENDNISLEENDLLE